MTKVTGQMYWLDATYVLREDCVFGMGEPRAVSGLLRLVHTRFASNLVA